MPVAAFKTPPSPEAQPAAAPVRAVASLGPDSLAETVIETSRAADRRGPFRPERLISGRSRILGRNLALVFRLVDATALTAIAVLSLSLTTPTLSEAPLRIAAPLAFAVVAAVWALHSLHAYGFRYRETLSRHFIRVLAAAGLCAVLVTAAVAPFAGIGGLTHAVGLWFCSAFSGLCLLHIAWWSIVRSWRRQGRLAPNIVIVGATKSAERLIASALSSGEVSVLGVFDDREGRAPKTIRGVPMLGDLNALIGHKIMPYVDKVVVTVPTAAQHRVREIAARLSILPNPVTLFVDVDGQTGADILTRLADTPLAYVSGHPDNDGRILVKRLQDLVFGSIGLIVGLPIMALVALAVRLDSPGPVLFRQKRHGFNNEEIVVWKFRSMKIESSDPNAKRQVEADDVRVTRVGRVIRATSLDELPQIFNVLKGEMSLVGPRPHAIGMMTGESESARLVAEYAHRHRMKPGMTGWAAIHGSRGPVDTPELVRRRVALDIEYIERQSFWLDLYIMAVTIPCLLGDRHAVR